MPRPTAKQKSVRSSPQQQISHHKQNKTLQYATNKPTGTERTESTKLNNNNDQPTIVPNKNSLTAKINETQSSNNVQMKNDNHTNEPGVDIPEFNLLDNTTQPSSSTVISQQTKANAMAVTEVSLQKADAASLKSRPIILAKKIKSTEKAVELQKTPPTAFSDMPSLDFEISGPPPLLPLANPNSEKTIQVVKKGTTVSLLVSPIKRVNTSNSSHSGVVVKPAQLTTKDHIRQKKSPPDPKQAAHTRVLPSPLKSNIKNKRRKKAEKSAASKFSDENVDHVYVAEGLAEDCENLIENCLKVYKLNYEKFSEIWKQMNFIHIFHERTSSSELAELSEEAILIAKKYMLAQQTNFEVKVAGLFLVYAFLNLQPYEQFAALKLVPDDVPAIKDLELEARRQRRHDVLYILGHVLVKGPCQFHVSAREVGLEVPLKKYFDGTVHIMETGMGVIKRTHESMSLLQELTSMEDKLKTMKKRIEQRKINNDLCLAKHNAAGLLEELSQLIGDRTLTSDNYSKSSTDAKKAPDMNREDLVRSIKERAMCNVVEPMRHLTGVNERHDKSLTPPGATSELDKGEFQTVKSPSRIKGKGKGKGKGRSSAISLHDLFSGVTEQPLKAITPPPVITQAKELPILDFNDKYKNVKTDNVPKMPAHEPDKGNTGKFAKTLPVHMHNNPSISFTTQNHKNDNVKTISVLKTPLIHQHNTEKSISSTETPPTTPKTENSFKSPTFDDTAMETFKALNHSLEKGSVVKSRQTDERSSHKGELPKQLSSASVYTKEQSLKKVTRSADTNPKKHRRNPELDPNTDDIPLDEWIKNESMKEENPIIVGELDYSNESHNKIIDLINKIKRDDHQPNEDKCVINNLIDKSRDPYSESSVTPVQDLNINLDSIPVIQNSLNKNIDIEIIDHYQGGKDTPPKFIKIIDTDVGNTDENKVTKKIKNIKGKTIALNYVIVKATEKKPVNEVLKLNVEGTRRMYPKKRKLAIGKDNATGTVTEANSINKILTVTKEPENKSLEVSNESSTEMSPAISKQAGALSSPAVAIEPGNESGTKKCPAISKQTCIFNNSNVTEEPGNKKSLTVSKKSPKYPDGSKQKNIRNSPVIPKEAATITSPVASKQASTNNSPVILNKTGTKKRPFVSTDSDTKESYDVSKYKSITSVDASKESGPKRSPSISKQSGTNKSKMEETKSIVASVSWPTEEKISARRMRVERRELKRIRIKSKFKKLGILGIANFPEGTDDN